MLEQKQYPAKPEKVYFFATCLMDLFYPEAGLAGMQLMRREGVEVIFPPGPDLLRTTGLEQRLSQRGESGGAATAGMLQ